MTIFLFLYIFFCKFPVLFLYLKTFFDCVKRKWLIFLLAKLSTQFFFCHLEVAGCWRLNRNKSTLYICWNCATNHRPSNNQQQQQQHAFSFNTQWNKYLNRWTQDGQTDGWTYRFIFLPLCLLLEFLTRTAGFCLFFLRKICLYILSLFYINCLNCNI